MFKNAGQHEKVIRALATKRVGLVRGELLKAAKLESGGGSSDILRELEEAGFISLSVPLGKARKDALYRLDDEYSLFYLTWIATVRTSSKNPWITLCNSPKYRSWAGYAFENVCLKHVEGIKKALGIAGMQTTHASWHHRPKSQSDRGTQIDLLIDRSDRCINLCEMKFSIGEFTIDKRYARDLENKRTVFQRVTGTRKTIFMTMVTSNGLKQNQYSKQLVDSEFTADVLFDS